MPDKDPPEKKHKENRQPKPMSAVGLAVYLMSALIAGAVVWVGKSSKSFEQESSMIEQAKAKQIGDLEKRLLAIDLNVSEIDSFIKAAKEGNLQVSECDIADHILETSFSHQRVVEHEREHLTGINYLTVGQNMSYRHQEQKAYADLRMKIGHLKQICQSVFPVTAVSSDTDSFAEEEAVGAVFSINESPRPWHDKAEITFDNNR